MATRGVTPRVPIQTPFFDDDNNVNRSWVIFFERLGTVFGGGGGPFQRTLLIKNTAVGDNIADVTTVYVDGTAARITGVLRTAIDADLVVRVRYNTPDDPGTINELVTLTIPAATAINTPVSSTEFTADSLELGDQVCLLWDITASDGQTDAGGVASVTLQWE